MTDDIAALIEEAEHLLAILEQKATEEMGGYDYVRPKIRKAKDALSCLTTTPLPKEIAGLIAETEQALQEVPQDILRRNLNALRALAQENERCNERIAKLENRRDALVKELRAIRAKAIKECIEAVGPELPYTADRLRALAQTDETKSNVAEIANSHI